MRISDWSSDVCSSDLETMQIVSAVYPNANVDLSGRKVVLHPSHAPMERKLVGPHLRLVDSRPAKTAPRSSVSKAAAKAKLDSAEPLLPFPSGSLTYGSREAAFREIGRASCRERVGKYV